MLNNTPSIILDDDGETGQINQLTFHSRALHGRLAAVTEENRPAVVEDALELGAEILARASQHGDLENLNRAVERLDEESKRIVATTTETVNRSIDKTVTELAATIQGKDGPLAALLGKLDPTADGNLIDTLRDLIAATATKATKNAVHELAEATHENMERLTKSLGALERIAAVEKARAEEAEKGTAKGFQHELDTETLLGELVAVAGDSLDDVSTTPGLQGTKKGDKTITPRGGCTIVTEEKCTAKISETKARALLDEAMANRGSQLGMLIVDDEAKVPGNQPFHFIDDDKVVVVAERLPLRLVYCLLRAKAIEVARAIQLAAGDDVADLLDDIRQSIESITRAVDRFKLLRTEHTKASKAISQAGRYVNEAAEAIADEVASIIGALDGLSSTDHDLAA